MESTKLTNDDPLMPRMYPADVYSLEFLVKAAPLSGPEERRKAKLPACLSHSHLFLSCFMQTMYKACVFQGTFHCGLEQCSCSYAEDELAFHFVM